MSDNVAELPGIPEILKNPRILKNVPSMCHKCGRIFKTDYNQLTWGNWKNCPDCEE